jgi:hypothetical protein
MVRELEPATEPFTAPLGLKEPDSGGGILDGRAHEREGCIDGQGGLGVDQERP